MRVRKKKNERTGNHPAGYLCKWICRRLKTLNPGRFFQIANIGQFYFCNFSDSQFLSKSEIRRHWIFHQSWITKLWKDKTWRLSKVANESRFHQEQCSKKFFPDADISPIFENVLEIGSFKTITMTLWCWFFEDLNPCWWMQLLSKCKSKICFHLTRMNPMASRRLSKPSDNSESPFLETPRLKSFCFTKESSSSFLPCRPPDIEWEVVCPLITLFTVER